MTIDILPSLRRDITEYIRSNSYHFSILIVSLFYALNESASHGSVLSEHGESNIPDRAWIMPQWVGEYIIDGRKEYLS